MSRRCPLIILAFAAVLAAAPAKIWAEPLSSEDLLDLEEKAARGGYWHMSLLGGIAIPTDTMSETFKEGIVANFRLGYTGRAGFGAVLGASYSPLSPRSSMQDFETHLGFLTAAPRYTIGHDYLRMWFGAGGGVAIERSREGVISQTTSELMGFGEAGLELFIFSNGGLSFQGNYVRSFGDAVNARLFNALGGLVFTF